MVAGLAKPLPSNGSWSVRAVSRETTTLPRCKDAPGCLRVLFAGSPVVCSFVVAQGLPPEGGPRVINANEEAESYMAKQHWSASEERPKVSAQEVPTLPAIARAAHVWGRVSIDIPSWSGPLCPFSFTSGGYVGGALTP